MRDSINHALRTLLAVASSDQDCQADEPEHGYDGYDYGENVDIHVRTS
jgi:hypothetical protein